jgi:uncharacterized protein YndB with AHSA1/START domain
MTEIRQYLTIRAPVEKIYRALTEQEGLAGWWTEDTIAKPEVNAIIEFKFGDVYHNKMRITRLEPDRRVEWECIEGDEQWIGTTFSFDLEPENDQVILRFTHGNWEKPTDFFASCNYHWGIYLRSLKHLCETGKGEPYGSGN